MPDKSRIEHDFLGEKIIPVNAYYGIQTLRAIENFKITDIPISIEPEMIRALGYVKKSIGKSQQGPGNRAFDT